MKLVPLHSFPSLHESEVSAFQVFAGAEVSASQIQLHYQVKSGSQEIFDTLILPEVGATPSRLDNLWKETCFECFIPSREGTAYLEFNGSPNGNWNWYAFRNYREGMSLVPLTGLAPKQVSFSKNATSLEVKWTLPFAEIKQSLGSEAASDLGPFGLTVVLNTRSATTYWAIQHEGVKPDFHLRASFTYDSFRH